MSPASPTPGTESFPSTTPPIASVSPMQKNQGRSFNEALFKTLIDTLSEAQEQDLVSHLDDFFSRVCPAKELPNEAIYEAICLAEENKCWNVHALLVNKAVLIGCLEKEEATLLINGLLDGENAIQDPSAIKIIEQLRTDLASCQGCTPSTKA